MRFTAPLSERISSWRDSSSQGSLLGRRKDLLRRLADVCTRTWDLGFTAFGGPPVHFQILHQRFVEGRGGKQKWVDEQTVRHVSFISME